MKRVWTLRVEEKFDAAHKLNDYKGLCRNLHGHSFRVVLTYKTTKLQANGISIDFKQLKAIMKKYLPDHQYLNDLYDFNPTAEHLAEEFYRMLSLRLKRFPGRVVAVGVWETDKHYAEYTEED